MLSSAHKANILRKAGYAVPACPGETSPMSVTVAPGVLHGDSPYQNAHSWNKAIDMLYVSYAAARAAKSLRDAEEAQQLAMLQRRPAPRAYA